MRKLFSGYYRPSEQEFAHIWQKCIFAFDANTLLNVYRYTSSTRESFLGIIDKLKDRVWIPYQAAYEYHQNRLEVISQQMTPYEKIEVELNDSLQRLEKILDGSKRHPIINVDELKQKLAEAIQGIKASLEEIKSKHPDLIEKDELRDRITHLFEGKVGKPYPEGELEKIYKEAEARIKRQIPPGYKDATKDDVKKYGDVILWFQLLELAQANKKPVIFVTDDRKEDWWLIHRGKTIGPRPELIQEMEVKAGVVFYMYQTDQFIGHAEKFLNLENQRKVIDEVRDVQRHSENLSSSSNILAILRESKSSQISSILNNDEYWRALDRHSKEFRRALGHYSKMSALLNNEAFQRALSRLYFYSASEELEEQSSKDEENDISEGSDTEPPESD